jgi:hypothetical protein
MTSSWNRSSDNSAYYILWVDGRVAVGYFARQNETSAWGTHPFDTALPSFDTLEIAQAWVESQYLLLEVL